jgi:predicted kinase
MNLEQGAKKVDRVLPDAPAAVGGGSLLALAGLPGSGKSLVARTLQSKVPSVVISTDVTRGILGCKRPDFEAERRFVYEVCYRVTRMRLDEGQRVIFDGSNHAVAHRTRLANLADTCGVTVAFCYVWAADDVVFERLRLRDASDRPEDIQSNARWGVNRLMAALEEPIARPHLELDSSTARPEELASTALTYWLDGERAG